MNHSNHIPEFTPEVLSITKSGCLPPPTCCSIHSIDVDGYDDDGNNNNSNNNNNDNNQNNNNNDDSGNDDSFGFFLDEDDDEATDYSAPLNDDTLTSAALTFLPLPLTTLPLTTLPLTLHNDDTMTQPIAPLKEEDSELHEEHIAPTAHVPGAVAGRPISRRSSMKNVSSYGSMEIIGEGIPLSEAHRAFKVLPPPSTACADRNKLSINMRRIASTASFFQQHDHSPAATAATATATAPAMKREVSFSEVKVRGYGQTIGDNPSVSYGTPISLDWDYEEKEPLSLDDYEMSRPISQRRDMRGMMLNHYQRKFLLSRNGFSEKDIQAAKKEVEKLQRQRGLTNFLLPVNKLEDMAESALRKTKRAMGMQSSLSTGCFDQLY